ncbi:SNF2 family N-terminal domain-containing protein [Xylariomycetidae sp. FL0641]|nr:SNF2 family N-terminal domain-containing protein [Xylariomycetidae sp. FL0641]
MARPGKRKNSALALPWSKKRKTKGERAIEALAGNQSTAEKVASILQRGNIGKAAQTEDREENQRMLKEAIDTLGSRCTVADKEDGLPNELFHVRGMKSLLHDYQVVAVSFALRYERLLRNTKGSILADDMGVGKTPETIAVMVANTPSKKVKAEGGGVNLIVVPSRDLAQQWEKELFKHADANPEGIYHYQGTGIPLLGLRAMEYIIVTYSQLLVEHKKHKKHEGGKIFRMSFWRVVLDEGDAIKNIKGATSKACMELTTKYAMVLSGTPLSNCPEEAIPYLRFIGIDIKEPQTEFEERWHCRGQLVPDSTRARILVILRKVMMRRVQEQVFMGRPICAIPQSHIRTVHLKLSPEEQATYDWVEKVARETFTTLKRAEQSGKAPHDCRTYSYQLVTHLRQSTQHPLCSEGSIASLFNSETKHEFIEDLDTIEPETDAFKNIKRWLRGIPVDALQSSANFRDAGAFRHHNLLNADHKAKREPEDSSDSDGGSEIVEWHKGLSPGDDYHGLQPRTKGDPASWVFMQDRRNPPLVVYGTLLEAVVDQIAKWQRKAPNDKIIVFSEYLRPSQILGRMLNQRGLGFLYYWGKMTPIDRTRALEDFATNAKIKILLAGTKAGAKGLNITCANRVIMICPWWNINPMKQAWGRVKRHGQKKETYMVFFVVKKTIEEKILKLRERKLEDCLEALEQGRKPKPLSQEEREWLLGFGDLDNDNDGPSDDSEEDDNDDDVLQERERVMTPKGNEVVLRRKDRTDTQSLPGSFKRRRVGNSLSTQPEWRRSI